MPNWITNKISAPPHVIEAMLNDAGHVDFTRAMPCPCPHGTEWNGIYADAEAAADAALNLPLSSHPLLASLEAANRAETNVGNLNDESFEQFVGMLRNHRACGYLHSMDFARKEWGTKWNACESSVDIAAGTAEFDTAWSCPKPVLAAVSRRFPDDEITVVYADEDAGSNCGTYTLKAGAVVRADEAGDWSSMSDDDKRKWTAFAYEVKGWEPEGDESE